MYREQPRTIGERPGMAAHSTTVYPLWTAGWLSRPVGSSASETGHRGSRPTEEGLAPALVREVGARKKGR
jgi:hypothetical protein